MGTLDRSSFKDWVVNPPRDSARGNFVMGGPDGPNLRHRGPEPYAIADLQGWLSLKTIRKGRGVWVTPDGRHQLDEGFAVILNDGQAYGFELSVDEPVETFCAFFRPGFIEDAVRAVGLSEEALLGDPQPAPSGTIEFAERVHPTEPAVCRRLEPLYELSAADDVEPLAWDEPFADLAVALLLTRDTLRYGLAPKSARASTRSEITRRLGRAVDYIHDNASRPVGLADIAAAAALSPHHFHRLFSQVLKRTPHRYMSDLRLNRATRLLARTDLPVTEVFFWSAFPVSEAFRRCSPAPTDLRRQLGAQKRKIREASLRAPLRLVGMTPVNMIDAHKLGILGDCHIHPGKGLDWPSAVLRAVSRTELIVTLGDMGETAGLDRLAALAPVIGVRGRDDAEDVRTAAALRVLQLGEVRIGCVFDPTEHGLASHADPFTPLAGWTATARALFGGPIHVLLYASTHRANVAELDGILIVNPGSAVLPADGAAASFALLKVHEGRAEAEIVPIDDPRPV